MSSKNLINALKKLSATKVTFGYQGPSGDEKHPGSDLSIAELAAVHEYGAGNVPARPLIRVTADRNRQEFKDAAKTAARTVANAGVRDAKGRFAGRDVDKAVQPVAEAALDALRRTLARSRDWAEPLSLETVARKGHNQPLVAEHESLDKNASWGIVRNGTIVEQGGEK